MNINIFIIIINIHDLYGLTTIVTMMTYRRAGDARPMRVVVGHSLDQSATSEVVTSPTRAPACR